MLVGESGVCPNCGVTAVFAQADNSKTVIGYGEKSETVTVTAARCPGCEMVHVVMTRYDLKRGMAAHQHPTHKLLYPQSSTRASVPAQVPPHIQKAYNEAASVESLSPVAAAIMARRSLELALQDLKIPKGHNLKGTIDNAAKDPRASRNLIEQLHRLRDSGNYGAHPDLIQEYAAYEVEDTELDAAFDALQDLFEDFYVKPQLLDERRKKFEEKDKAAKEKLQAAKAAKAV